MSSCIWRVIYKVSLMNSAHQQPCTAASQPGPWATRSAFSGVIFAPSPQVDARASEATQAKIRAARVHTRVILVQYRLVVQTTRLEKPRLPMKLVVV